MAIVLDQMTPVGNHYPWDEWTDGRVWLVERDVDFFTDREEFRHYLYKVAKRQGMKVATRMREGQRVEFQFRKEIR